MKSDIYDIAGIGIGPFNLGLAALSSEFPELKTIFFDAKECFSWHPGLLIEDARLQVPFFADLVTPVSPCSTFSYMSYLHAHQRLFRFAIRENYFIKRQDYNKYCQWVTAQLPNLHFNHECREIHYDNKTKYYKICTSNGDVHAKYVVFGIGTIPDKPSCEKKINNPLLLHSGDYLFKKEQLLQQKKITLIGSGQSAAEIFYDLLKTYDGTLDWFSRSEGFIPMDYSKFALEKTSLDYINYFYHLPDTVKQSVLKTDKYLYKGINGQLIADIYDLLDDGVKAKVSMHPYCNLKNIKNGFTLSFTHLGMKKNFQHASDAVILATGYKPATPAFVGPIRHIINRDKNSRFLVSKNYSVDNANTLFVLNADLHSHGFNSSDLGMGTYRNATILNTILGYEHYKLKKTLHSSISVCPIKNVDNLLLHQVKGRYPTS